MNSTIGNLHNALADIFSAPVMYHAIVTDSDDRLGATGRARRERPVALERPYSPSGRVIRPIACAGHNRENKKLTIWKFETLANAS